MNLKVISFNIRCMDDPDGYSIAERAPRLYKITSEYNADVIGFQEYRPAWEKYIYDLYGDEYDIFYKYRNMTVDIEAAPILWKKNKFIAVKTGYFWLSDTPEIESRGWDERFNCYRMCTYVILKEKQTGKLFTVMNTHFGFGDDGQRKSAELIYNYSKEISDHKTFVVGDFNMLPESEGYKTITKYFYDVNACTANDLNKTYHGYNPDNPDLNSYHIDYCFAQNSITPINQTLITQTVDGKYPSDHYGLFIELDI